MSETRLTHEWICWCCVEFRPYWMFLSILRCYSFSRCIATRGCVCFLLVNFWSFPFLWQLFRLLSFSVYFVGCSFVLLSSLTSGPLACVASIHFSIIFIIHVDRPFLIFQLLFKTNKSFLSFLFFLHEIFTVVHLFSFRLRFNGFLLGSCCFVLPLVRALPLKIRGG